MAPESCNPTLSSEWDKDDMEDESNISIAPNPARDILTIYFEQSLEADQYAVYDGLGKPVVFGQLDSVLGSSLEINIKRLPEGVYYFRVWADAVDIGKRFVKVN